MICKECRHPWELHRNGVGCLAEGCPCGVDADESAHAWERPMGDVMRKAHEYLDGKRTRGEDSIIRDLMSAVEKVLELHQPVDIEPSETICAACSTLRGTGENARYFPFTDYPCPTVQAIQDALGDVDR